MRARSSLILEALLDGGQVHLVTVDQRDYAKWEAQPFRDEEAVHTKLRFLTWSAMRREKRTGASWPEFNDSVLIEAGVPDEGESEGEDEQGLDPGSPAMSATP